MSQNVEQFVKHYGSKKHAVIMILQDIQDKYNYLPQEILKDLSVLMDIPLSRIYSIATYYKLFSLKPKGKHLCQVCLGTACHVRGAGKILERLERDLNIHAGDTTEDLQFSLETVRCVGACSLAPVVIVDENAHGRLSQGKIPKLLGKYK